MVFCHGTLKRLSLLVKSQPYFFFLSKSEPVIVSFSRWLCDHLTRGLGGLLFFFLFLYWFIHFVNAIVVGVFYHRLVILMLYPFGPDGVQRRHKNLYWFEQNVPTSSSSLLVYLALLCSMRLQIVKKGRGSKPLVLCVWVFLHPSLRSSSWGPRALSVCVLLHNQKS